MPRQPHFTARRHAARPDAAAGLLPRLVALEAALIRQAGPRGLAPAPASLVRLVRDLLDETGALLPGRTGKSALPRLRPEQPVGHAELSVIAGQARAALAAVVSARGPDTPPAAANPRIAAMRRQMATRLSQLVAERDAALARAEQAEARDTPGA